MIATPRFTTPHTPSRRNLLVAARNVAKLLGFTLMEWQEDVIALFTEMDDTGHFVFRDCTLLCPRQQGKTTLLAVLLIVRCIADPETHCWYAAQSGKDGRAMLLDQWAPMLAKSALNGNYHLRQANGSEQMRFANDSTISLLSSTASAGHGVQSDFTILDEAFSYTDSRLENAAVPAMATRHNHGPGPQLTVVSTAGTPDASPYLLAKVEQGRNQVAEGITEGTAYVEYSAPDGADPMDPATWYACNPALGITISEQAVHDELRTMDVVDFQRSRLNQWTSSLVDPVVPLSTWHALVEQFSSPGNDLVLAFDSTPTGSRSSIAIASKRADGRIHVELIANQECTGWLISRIKELAAKYEPRTIVCDGKSPAANVLPELGLQVRELGKIEAAKHYAGFVAACNEGTLVHREQPDLTTALAGAVRRPLDDAFAWSRRNSSIDVSPIVAVSMALYIVQSDGIGQGIWSLDEIVAEKRRAAAQQQQPTEQRPVSDTRVIPMSEFYSQRHDVDMRPTQGVCPTEAPDICRSLEAYTTSACSLLT